MRKIGVAVSCLAVTGVVLPVSAGAASAVVPCTKAVPNDLNNDGKSDVVIGQPKATVDGVADAGAVDIRITGGTSLRITPQTTGLGATAAKLGTSVVIGYLNDDCYADLLLGAPGTQGGRVIYYPGGTQGIDAANGMILQSDNPSGSDRFGSSVVIGQKVAFIGAPFADPNNVKNAGRIYMFTKSADSFAARGVLQQGTAPVKDSPESGDHFGAVMSFNGPLLAVGVPDENIAAVKNAGAAHLITMDEASPWKPDTDVFLNQDAPGVTGTAEKGDRFGAAIDNQIRAIGVPGEDVKEAVDAGGIYTQVQTMITNAPALRWVSQSTSGVPGKSKSGDRFGSALASGMAFLCPGKVSIAVGVPGKAVKNVVGAGVITTVSETGSDCGTVVGRQTTQDTPQIGGKVAQGNAFGSALITVPTIGLASDGLLGGTPGASKQAGRVVNAVNLPKTAYWSLGGKQAGSMYGSVTTKP
jgi:hypothetical protein